MIQKACGNETMGCMPVEKWFKPFKERWMLIKSDERSGRPPQAGTI